MTLKTSTCDRALRSSQRFHHTSIHCQDHCCGSPLAIQQSISPRIQLPVLCRQQESPLVDYSRAGRLKKAGDCLKDIHPPAIPSGLGCAFVNVVKTWLLRVQVLETGNCGYIACLITSLQLLVKTNWSDVSR